jgi:hypothetical protein
VYSLGKTDAGHRSELLLVPQIKQGAPVLDIDTETTPVAVTLLPEPERSIHTLSAILKESAVYKPMRPEITGGGEMAAACNP